MKISNKIRWIVPGLLVSGLALGAIGGATDVSFGFAGPAMADGHETGGQGKGKPEGAGGGNSGGHDDGHDDGHDGEDHAGGGRPDDKGPGQGGNPNAGGAGQGGPGEDSDGKGPRAGAQGDHGGGKPIWAQEGIPEVELGRLNVARSPDQVLDRAYDEALSNFTAEMAAFYNLPLDEAILQLSTNFDNLTMIDSPLQNLALLKDALDGTSILNTLPEVSNSNSTLMAMFLGVASDKNVSISPDTALAVSMILDQPLTEAEAAALAADAEAVRIAVLAGHG